MSRLTFPLRYRGCLECLGSPAIQMATASSVWSVPRVLSRVWDVPNKHFSSLGRIFPKPKNRKCVLTCCTYYHLSPTVFPILILQFATPKMEYTREKSAKKNAATTVGYGVQIFIRKSIFFAFNFNHFFCGSCYNLESGIAHNVQKRVKLAALCRFFGLIVQEERLIHRNVVTGNKLIENLEAWILPFILNIGKIAREMYISSLTCLRLSLRSLRAALIAAPKALKSHFDTGRFAILIHSVTFYGSPSLLDMFIQFL